VVQNAYDRGVAFLQHGLRCGIFATGVAFEQHPFDLQIFSCPPTRYNLHSISHSALKGVR